MARFLMPLVVFLAILAVAEFVLGLLPLEQFDSEFAHRRSNPVYVPGSGDMEGLYVTNPHFKGSLNFQAFAMEKPPVTARVFIVGGSAAAGWAGRDEDAFSGYLRRSFDQVVPGRFEVVNAAGISYGSHRVKDVVEDVLLHSPDLIVLYSGNNEYVERNVLPDRSRGPEGRFLIRLRDILSRSNIYRAVRLLMWNVPPLRVQMEKGRSADITDIRETPIVHRGKLGRTRELDVEVLENYRNNLMAIGRLAEKADVPVIFATIPVNLDSWRPDGVPPAFPDEEIAKRWSGLLERGKGHLEQKRPDLGLKYLAEAMELAPDWAPAAYLYGKALQAAGRMDDARDMYKRARDNDARPMRAFGSFNEALREVANEIPVATLLDLEIVFQEHSPGGITGSELMMDYCHPTEKGHKLIAMSLFPRISKVLGVELPVAKLREAVEKDQIVALKNPRSKADQLYARAMNYQFNGRIEEAETVYRQILQLDPDNSFSLSNLGVIFYQRGELETARELFTQAVEANPENIDAVFNLGLIRMAFGQLDEAEKLFGAVLDLNELSGPANVALGDISQEKGNILLAKDYYDRALSLGGDSAHLRFMLGKAHHQLGDREQALLQLRRALEMDPLDSRISNLLEELGDTTQLQQ